MKFILAVGIPLLAIYCFICLAQFRSMGRLASRDGSLRSRLAVEMVADYLDSRLVRIGTVARTVADFAEKDPEATKATEASLLKNLLTTEPLVFGASIAWGNPKTEPLTGWRSRREADGIKSTALTTVEAQRVAKRYLDANNPYGGWTEPWTTEAEQIKICAYFHPFVINDEVVGLIAVGIRLEDLQNEAARELPLHSRFVIVDDSWIIVSTENPQDIGKPVSTLVDTPDLPNMTQLREVITSERESGKPSNATHAPTHFEGENYWIAWAVLEETQWLLLDAVPESTILEPVYSLFQRDILIGVIGLVVIVVVIIVMGLLLTHRLRRLNAAMDRARTGDLSVRVETGSGIDEISQMIRGFNQMIESLESNVDALAQAEASRLSVERELDIARDIQQSLQPHVAPRFERPVDVEIAAVNLPAHHVAGDFYDYWALDDRHLAFMLGDVAGKGVPAAIFMGVARTTLRMVATREHDPAAILKRVNHRLQADNEQGLFVTLFLGVYDTRTGNLKYANAGHHPGLLQPAVGEPRSVTAATGTILGTLDGATWTTETLQIEPGDHFILYTDGLVEAHGADGKMVDTDGVVKRLRTLGTPSAKEVCDQLADIAETVQDGNLFDDVTVMDLHRLHSTPSDAPSGDSSEPGGTG
ncbi:MAG: SpoIIE family protein phosphatase [Phycisphaerales bacterium]|nr:SpoIIE family protein phosphatase [Phycisphaerales bacterium]